MLEGSLATAVPGEPPITRAELAQMVVQSKKAGRTGDLFFPTVATAESAFNRLLGTVTSAAKGCGVAKVISMGCRFLQAITALGGDARDRLNEVLTNAACIACNMAVQLKWRPVGSTYELNVVPCDCT